MLADDHAWSRLPPPVAYWLELQRERSVIPGRDEVLIETFPRGNCHYLVAYPFEGRLAHQTLGMLLTRRLDRVGAGPLGFVANDYGMALWCIGDLSALIAAGKLDLDELFAQDMLGDDLDAWLAESNLMKRTFRQVAVIAGLVERRHPGREKTGRQVATVDKPHLRRVAPPRSASHSARGRLGRRGHRPLGHCTAWGIFCAASTAESGINPWTGCRRFRCRSCSKSARRPSPGLLARSCCARLPPNRGPARRQRKSNARAET